MIMHCCVSEEEHLKIHTVCGSDRSAIFSGRFVIFCHIVDTTRMIFQWSELILLEILCFYLLWFLPIFCACLQSKKLSHSSYLTSELLIVVSSHCSWHQVLCVILLPAILLTKSMFYSPFINNLFQLWMLVFQLCSPAVINWCFQLSGLKLPDHWMKHLFIALTYLELQLNDDALRCYQQLLDSHFSCSTYVMAQLAMAYHNLRG